MEIGDVFVYDASYLDPTSSGGEHQVLLAKVLAIDPFAALVDICQEDAGWRMDKMKKGRVYFSYVGLDVIAERMQFVQTYPVSDEYLKFYHANLLSRIGRVSKLNWNDPAFEEKSCLSDFLHARQSTEWLQQKLGVDQLYLAPISKNGLRGKPQLIIDVSRNGFSTLELLWQASQIQRAVKNIEYSGGIGIHREGSLHGIPVYYIGRYFDNAGILKKYEMKGINTAIN